MKKQLHPSLTPTRAMRLLTTISIHKGRDSVASWPIWLGRDLHDALENHVLHALSKSRRRKRK